MPAGKKLCDICNEYIPCRGYANHRKICRPSGQEKVKKRYGNPMLDQGIETQGNPKRERFKDVENLTGHRIKDLIRRGILKIDLDGLLKNGLADLTMRYGILTITIDTGLTGRVKGRGKSKSKSEIKDIDDVGGVKDEDR